MNESKRQNKEGNIDSMNGSLNINSLIKIKPLVWRHFLMVFGEGLMLRGYVMT